MVGLLGVASPPKGKAGMGEAITDSVKYVFLDVVRFSTARSVEAQTDIVDSLNAIVRESVGEQTDSSDETIFLPTGDGICIALLSPPAKYDIHLRIALDILTRIFDHNTPNPDPMRKFEVRVGLNENVDNIVTDINKKKNVAGAGVNIAQRVMSLADEGQILVGQTVFETLCQREKYMKSFRPFEATVKHGVKLRVHQFLADAHRGLNTNIPSAFVTVDRSRTRLSLYEAYYFAHAIRLRDFFTRRGDPDWTAVVLLHFLALDSEGLAKSRDIDPYEPRIFGRGKASLEQTFDYYNSTDFYLSAEFGDFVTDRMQHRESYFDMPLLRVPIFVNDRGKAKLKKEYPEIWETLGLGEISEPPS